MSPPTRFLTPTLLLAVVLLLVVRCPLSPYLTFAFGAAFLMQILSRPQWKEWLTSGIVAACFAAVRMHIDPGANASGPYLPLAFLGMASLAVTIVPVFRLTGAERTRRLQEFIHRAALPFLALMAGVFVAHTARWMPITYDSYLYAFDWSFGFQAGFFAGRLFERLAWLRALEYFAYFGLPLGLGLTAAKSELHSTGRTLLIFVVAGLIGFALYALMPAAGPAYLFPDSYPYHAPRIGDFSIRAAFLPGDAPRNAMPSLHTAWAVLMIWNCRRSARWVRATVGLLGFLTLLGTLGWGQHYLIDLIVGVPFALAVQGICTTGPGLIAERLKAISIGTGMTLSWIVGLRVFVPLVRFPIPLTWLLAVTTLGGCFWMERNLLQQARVLANSHKHTPAPRFARVPE